jgi:hypothetical protein
MEDKMIIASRVGNKKPKQWSVLTTLSGYHKNKPNKGLSFNPDSCLSTWEVLSLVGNNGF